MKVSQYSLKRPAIRLAFLILTIASFSSLANIDCKFDLGDGTQVAIGSTPQYPFPDINIVSAVSSPTKISGSSPIIFRLIPNLKTICQVGDDGENLFQKTAYSPEYITAVDGKALFKTNVTGLAYTVAISTDQSFGLNFFSTPTTDYVFHNMDNRDDMMVNRSWIAHVEIYQLPSYAGLPSGFTSLTAANTVIGEAVVGSPYVAGSEHPHIKISANSSSIQLPIKGTTCNFSAPKTVDLGTYTTSQVNKNLTTVKPINITGSCSVAPKVSVKLTTTKTTGAGNMLLANRLTGDSAAQGVGVEIVGPNRYVMTPNADIRANIDYKFTAPSANFTMPFTGQLVKDGSRVTAGSFESIGVFQISYY